MSKCIHNYRPTTFPTGSLLSETGFDHQRSSHDCRNEHFTEPNNSKNRSTTGYESASKILSDEGSRRGVIELLKPKLVAYLEAIGVELISENDTKRSGRGLFHDHTNTGLQTYVLDSEHWHCFPCAEGGDIFDFARRFHGCINFEETLSAILRTLTGAAGLIGVSRLVGRELAQRRKRRRPAHRQTQRRAEPLCLLHKGDKPQLDYKRANQTREMRRKGVNPKNWEGFEVAQTFVDEFGFRLEELPGCIEGGDSIGFLQGRVCYIYAGGIKVRNPQGSEERFYWDHGNVTAPWRSDRIGNHARTVFITNGESDALALLASGVEVEGCTVIALGGPSFRRCWAARLRGKKVVLCFDFDRAGRKAACYVASILKGIASEIITVKEGHLPPTVFANLPKDFLELYVSHGKQAVNDTLNAAANGHDTIPDASHSSQGVSL